MLYHGRLNTLHVENLAGHGCTFGEGKQRSNYHAVCVVGASECACMSSAVLYVRIVSYSISLSAAEMCAMSGLRDKVSRP